MFSSTTFSSSRRRLQRANPSGAGEQARAINLASAAPSKIRLRAEFGIVFALQRRLKSLLHQPPPEAADIVDTGVQRPRDRAVAPAFARLRHAADVLSRRYKQSLRRHDKSKLNQHLRPKHRGLQPCAPSALRRRNVHLAARRRRTSMALSGRNWVQRGQYSDGRGILNQ